MPDVDEPNTTSAGATRLALAKSSCLSSTRSGALSWTKSTSVTAASGVSTNVIVPSLGNGARVNLA